MNGWMDRWQINPTSPVATLLTVVEYLMQPHFKVIGISLKIKIVTH